MTPDTYTWRQPEREGGTHDEMNEFASDKGNEAPRWDGRDKVLAPAY